jgi:glycosyltransferase involved in cell wall biosynthesis
MTRPSVVHLVWSGAVGGIERLVHDLAAEQTRLGMDVSAAFGQAGGFFYERIGALGVHVIDLEIRSGYDLWPARSARGAALLERSDLVHAHGFNLPLGALMRRVKRPVVFTEHGQFGLGRSLGSRDRLKLRVQRHFLTHRCTAIAANSRWTAERLSRTYRIEPERVAVVYNGIEPIADDVTAGTREGPDELVVVFVGQLKPFKRVDRLIRAIAGIRDQTIRALIAGGGPLEGELRSLAREVGVDRQVRFLGWTRDIASVLRRGDVLVLPSEEEPFGLAMVEGCAHGLLPIAFADSGGALEAIAPDGRVVADVGELAAVLQEVRGTDALSHTARVARSVWARQEFPIAKTATRYLELYRSALARHQGDLPSGPPPAGAR